MSSHDVSDESPREWLTTAEAVALLPDVTVRTLQRWADNGKVPSVALPSGRRRFRRADIEALLSVHGSRP